MAYAEKTRVSADATMGEIKRMVQRAGGRAFATFEDDISGRIAFELQDRRIIFRVDLPAFADFQKTETGRARSIESSRGAWEQACRARWRALLLVIKAKLESVSSGIETVEQAFLAQVMMPDGQTVSDHVAPRIREAYAGGEVPRLLPPGGR
jgi:hypothetical protein